MRVLVDKTVMLAACLTLAVASEPSPGAWFVVSTLAAVCAAALSEWAGPPRLRCVIAAVAATLACVTPHLNRYLPVFAYDAMRVGIPRGLSGGMRAAAPPVAQALARWLWLAPLLVGALGAMVRVSPAHAAATPRTVATGCAAVLLTVAGALFGRASARADALALALSRTEDETRDVMRRQRSRIADGEEERAASVRMATLGERTRIAREIHDNVGHLLTRAIMQAEAFRVVSEASGDAQGAERFARIGATVDEAMTMVRRSVHDLEDDGTDFAAQIEAAAHSLDAADVGFAVELDNAVDSAPAPVARCLATVIREALSNVAHHSDAGRVTVTLHDFPAFWQLAVQDDGGRAAGPAAGGRPARESRTDGGGHPDGYDNGRGMGLADIDARVRALGGTASCGPYGKGWRVFVSLPKAPWHDAAAAGNTGTRE